MIKFKVGDKVTIIENDNKDKKYIGEIHEIKEIRKDFMYPYKLSKIDFIWWKDSELQSVETKTKQFTKADLKERYIVKFRNDDEYIVNLEQKEFQNIKDGVKTIKYNPLSFYDDNLIENRGHSQLDVVEVYKPKYETIWTREETKEIVEMTMEQVIEKLGYDFKLVGGKN